MELFKDTKKLPLDVVRDYSLFLSRCRLYSSSRNQVEVPFEALKAEVDSPYYSKPSSTASIKTVPVKLREYKFTIKEETSASYKELQERLSKQVADHLDNVILVFLMLGLQTQISTTIFDKPNTLPLDSLYNQLPAVYLQSPDLGFIVPQKLLAQYREELVRDPNNYRSMLYYGLTVDCIYDEIPSIVLINYKNVVVNISSIFVKQIDNFSHEVRVNWGISIQDALAGAVATEVTSQEQNNSKFSVRRIFKWKK